MRPILALAVAAALWLILAPDARAQVGMGLPAFGSYGVRYGTGLPFTYGYSYSAPGYSYSAPAVGFGLPATTYYNSGYSTFVAPGTTTFYSSYYAPSSYGYLGGYPAYGYPVARPFYGRYWRRPFGRRFGWW